MSSSFERILAGRDEAVEPATGLHLSTLMATTDGADTDGPTVFDSTDGWVHGEAHGARLERSYDEVNHVWAESQYDADGTLQARWTPDAFRMHLGSEDAVSLELRDGLLVAYDASGNEAIRLDSGVSGDSGSVGRQMSLTDSIVRLTRSTDAAGWSLASYVGSEAWPRWRVRANGTMQWGNGTANPAVGFAYDAATGYLAMQSGGILSLYAQPPNANTSGPAGAMNGVGTTYTDVLSVTLTTTKATNLRVYGKLRLLTHVVTTAVGNTWQFRTLVDGVGSTSAYAGYNGDGQLVVQSYCDLYTSIAAGTHTIKLQAAANGTSNTIDIGAGFNQLAVEAFLP